MTTPAAVWFAGTWRRIKDCYKKSSSFFAKKAIACFWAGLTSRIDGERQQMPKRDEAYMEGQRELIERAALDCMLDKGVYNTTLREVCQRVGISMGALYVHYRTRDDLLLAALRTEPSRQVKPVSAWADYIATTSQFVQRIGSGDDHARRRGRLSLQFVAERSLEKQSPELFQTTLSFFRESLLAIHRNGEITLPLGLRATSETHQRLESGTILSMVADKTIDVRQATSTLLNAFAYTAGLTNAPVKRRLRQT
jgi:AcrR family transcriptional regulator